MVLVVSAEQMRRIDEQAIAGDAAIGYSYMRKAGEGLFEVVAGMVSNPDTQEIAIVCGRGNNGGDGYVLGRLLLENGYKPMCFGLCEGEELRGEARRAHEQYVERGGNFLHVDDAEDLEGFAEYSLIVDAILGTGITGNPRGLAAEIVTLMNASERPVLSVDTPSGLDNTTGRAGEPTTLAAVTVTMGFPKLGQFFYPGRARVGQLVVKDLGYPEEIVAAHGAGLFIASESDLRRLVPARRQAGSKFDHGLAFLLCGSRGMSGSAALASVAALRTGCGMAHLATPRSVAGMLSIKLTEAVIYPVEDTEAGSVSRACLDSLLEMAASMQAALIGPGLSHQSETSVLVRDMVSRATTPVVLDADGINAYRGCAEELKRHSSALILTPHAGEWQRLFGPLPDEPLERIDRIRTVAAEYSLTVLCKGSPTLVAGQSGDVFIVALGNSALASAGTGDVLGGIVVSLLAQGCCPDDAALLGASLHAMAGHEASRTLGEHSVIAGDIVDYIPVVLKGLAEEAPPVFIPDNQRRPDIEGSVLSR